VRISPVAPAKKQPSILARLGLSPEEEEAKKTAKAELVQTRAGTDEAVATKPEKTEPAAIITNSPSVQNGKKAEVVIRKEILEVRANGFKRTRCDLILKKKPSVSSAHEISVRTAEAIAQDQGHPKQAEVLEVRSSSLFCVHVCQNLCLHVRHWEQHC
jgi:hypothetical protein